MGNFYENITIADTQQAEIIRCLSECGYSAAVSPPVGGFSVIFVEISSSQHLVDICASLSLHLDAPALAVGNADDDLLELDLYLCGKHRASLDIGSYDDEMVLPAPLKWLKWLPNFKKRRRRDCVAPAVMANELCASMRSEVDVKGLENILTRTDYRFETDRHAALVEYLRLPDIAIATGYEYLRQGEWPAGLNSGLTRWTPEQHKRTKNL